MALQLPVLSTAARTDVGSFRRVNEDALLCAGAAYLVADGVGGHEAGDLAANAAISAFENLGNLPYASLDAIGAAYARARRAVNSVSAKTTQGAGTTLTGAILTRHENSYAWLILNVGDSRVYRYHQRQLQQLTVDHTLRNELLARGVSPDSPKLPAGNLITRALGADVDKLDTWLLPINPGERLLVCSDGLTDTLSDAELCRGLALCNTSQSADFIMAAALEQQPRDNVTLLLVDVLATEISAEIAVCGSDCGAGADECATADLTETVQELQKISGAQAEL